MPKRSAVETTIAILGKEYTIRSTEEADYTASLAEYIDSVMSRIADKAGSADTLKTAILALLFVSDELFKLRKEKCKMSSEDETKIDELIHKLNVISNQTTP